MRAGFLLLSGVALGCFAAAAPARAQGVGSPGSFDSLQSGPPSFAGEQLDRSLQGPQRAPAALPGAAKQQAIAPPTNVPALMSPNDEMFDAINRGDIQAVRDALSRGADLSAQNELGQTPIDLSIDLGRNDISFLLLSMRPPAPATPPVTAVAQSGKAPTPNVRPVRHGSRERTLQATEVAAQAPARPSLPTLYAGNGGTPIPQAGFLGFDSH